jgi:hypothetical protein
MDSERVRTTNRGPGAGNSGFAKSPPPGLGAMVKRTKAALPGFEIGNVCRPRSADVEGLIALCALRDVPHARSATAPVTISAPPQIRSRLIHIVRSIRSPSFRYTTTAMSPVTSR